MKDVNIDRKVQSKLQAQVAVDSTRHGNSTDDLQNGKRSTEGQGLDICLTVNAHFPINITTTSEISSMNQNNCITAESLQRFKQWKPGLDHKECWINDEVSFQGNWINNMGMLCACNFYSGKISEIMCYMYSMNGIPCALCLVVAYDPSEYRSTTDVIDNLFPCFVQHGAQF